MTTQWIVLPNCNSFDSAYEQGPIAESESGPGVPPQKFWVEVQSDSGRVTGSIVKKAEYIDGVWQEPEVVWKGVFVLPNVLVKKAGLELRFYCLDGNSKPEQFEKIRPLLPVLPWNLKTLFADAEATSRFNFVDKWQDFDRLKEAAMDAFLEEEKMRSIEEAGGPAFVHEPNDKDWL